MKDRAGTLLPIKIKDFSHHRFKNFKDLIYQSHTASSSDFYENSFVSPAHLHFLNADFILLPSNWYLPKCFGGLKMFLDQKSRTF